MTYQQSVEKQVYFENTCAYGKPRLTGQWLAGGSGRCREGPKVSTQEPSDVHQPHMHGKGAVAHCRQRHMPRARREPCLAQMFPPVPLPQQGSLILCTFKIAAMMRGQTLFQGMSMVESPVAKPVPAVPQMVSASFGVNSCLGKKRDFPKQIPNGNVLHF